MSRLYPQIVWTSSIIGPISEPIFGEKLSLGNIANLDLAAVLGGGTHLRIVSHQELIFGAKLNLGSIANLDLAAVLGGGTHLRIVSHQELIFGAKLNLGSIANLDLAAVLGGGTRLWIVSRQELTNQRHPQHNSYQFTTPVPF